MMTTLSTPAVYPGNYVPQFDEAGFFNELHQGQSTPGQFTGIITQESKDCYHIDITVPGVQREDFLLSADNNVLSIYMLHHSNEYKEISNPKESENKFIAQKIILPEDSDTLFIVAAYQSGVLKLYIPKTTKTINPVYSRIVIY